MYSMSSMCLSSFSPFHWLTFTLWYHPERTLSGLYLVAGFNLLSGKLMHNSGKSPCLMVKSTISMAIFHSYVSHCQSVWFFSLGIFLGWLFSIGWNDYIIVTSWLVVWNIFYFSIQLGIVIPVDVHIFQRGPVNRQPASDSSFWDSFSKHQPVLEEQLLQRDDCTFHAPALVSPPWGIFVGIFTTYLLVNQDSYWTWPLIVSFPSKNDGFRFSILMLAYQRIDFS